MEGETVKGSVNLEGKYPVIEYFTIEGWETALNCSESEMGEGQPS